MNPWLKAAAVFWLALLIFMFVEREETPCVPDDRYVSGCRHAWD